jgi:hypothetical protein
MIATLVFKIIATFCYNVVTIAILAQCGHNRHFCHKEVTAAISCHKLVNIAIFCHKLVKVAFLEFLPQSVQYRHFCHKVVKLAKNVDHDNDFFADVRRATRPT